MSNTPKESISIDRKKRGEVYRTREFDKDFFDLYIGQPFLSTISMEVTKVADSGVPTAYIGALPEDNDYVLTMGFNEDFLRNMKAEHRQGILCHELYHLVFQHVTKRTILDRRLHQLWNVATDLSINSIIGEANLPLEFTVPPEFRDPKDPTDDGKRGILMPGIMPKGKGDPMLMDFIAKAPKLQAADFYYEEMKKLMQNKLNQCGDGEGEDITGGIQTLDDHGGWGDLPAEIEEQIGEKVKDMIERAAKECDKKNTWGNIPQEIRERIRDLYSREIDWRQVLRNFWGRCRSIERISTIKRINKKAMYQLPGAKRKTKANFVCFIDQSGSMSDEDIAQLFAELENLAKETEIDVFHFDTSIDHTSHTKWKRGRTYPPHRTRCGGTDFSCISRYLNKQENRGRYSGCLILTDGYADKMPQVIGTKVMWVITHGGTLEAIRPGDLVVKMDDPKKVKPK
jgi:predicted metal-dependent peptidase